MKSHRQIDERALRLARRIVARIDADPARYGFEKARMTCARWERILPDDQRAVLEQKAIARAVAVDRCWRFYPKVIDRKLIDAARVEARLRQTHSE